MTAITDHIVHYFETLSPEALVRLDEIYAEQAHFKDPFNEVQGIPAIRHIFEHMYAQLENPRFVITERIEQAHGAMLGWDFHLKLRGQPTIVRGVTHLQWNAEGKITLHRDYWDPAEELYSKLPVLGALMRWLRARLAA